MIGIVIVAHGGLADEYKSALEHVVGIQQNLMAIGIGENQCYMKLIIFLKILLKCLKNSLSVLFQNNILTISNLSINTDL